MPTKCWECKNNVLTLRVLVPYDRTIKEYVHRTGNFQSDIVAVVKEKQEHYRVWFRSEGDIKLVTFKMLHLCKLKIESTKAECPCYRKNQEQLRISNITYSKQPTLEAVKTELALNC